MFLQVNKQHLSAIMHLVQCYYSITVLIMAMAIKFLYPACLKVNTHTTLTPYSLFS